VLACDYHYLPVDQQFSFSGVTDVVSDEDGAAAAVAKLREDASASKLDPTTDVTAVDTEWYAPRVRGVSPSKTSLIQVCSSADYCAVFLVGKMGDVPGCLWDFLRDKKILKVRTEKYSYGHLFAGGAYSSYA